MEGQRQGGGKATWGRGRWLGGEIVAGKGLGVVKKTAAMTMREGAEHGRKCMVVARVRFGSGFVWSKIG